MLTFALASLAASASAAMALCSCTGRRTSLLRNASKNGKIFFFYGNDWTSEKFLLLVIDCCIMYLQ